MIRREPEGATREAHDLIVIGGGMYGVCAAREAALRGIRTLLLEKSDFGGATTWNSLRFLHGGLRYLQTADIGRFRESYQERRWFLRTFPSLARILPCHFPLYGEGLRRVSVFRAALWANDLLSSNRNEGVREDRRIPPGRIVSRTETEQRFPSLPAKGLQGAGLWYDGFAPNPERLLMEILHQACEAGVVALNYVEARSPIEGGKGVCGVRAFDRVAGKELSFRGEKILSCAGPWCAGLAAEWGSARKEIFHPSVAFNLLLRKKPLWEGALALHPPNAAGGAAFVLPHRSWTLAGTSYAPRPRGTTEAKPTEEEIQRFLDDLNRALPALSFQRGDVLRIFAGLLPATEEGTTRLAKHPLFVDHRSEGMPCGLFTICGVKVTTARAVAEKAVRRIFPGRPAPSIPGGVERAASFGGIDPDDPRPFLGAPPEEVTPGLTRWIDEESVVYPEDLVYRRTDWGAAPEEADAAVEKVCRLLGCAPGEPVPR